MKPSHQNMIEWLKAKGKGSMADPDEFNGHFFQICWDIVVMISGFGQFSFCIGRTNPLRLVVNYHHPASKKEEDNIKSFSDLWSISLCNFPDKIISKLVVNQLKLIFNDIISPSQTGFTNNYM